MLSPEAINAFTGFCNGDFTDGQRKLDDEIQELNLRLGGQGNGRSGAFYKGMAKQFRAEFVRRANSIFLILKRVHEDYGRPLGENSSSQMNSIAANALSNQLQNLEREYIRVCAYDAKLAATASHLDEEFRQQLSRLKLEIDAYLKRLSTQSSQTMSSTSSIIVNNHGTIGALQTGQNAISNIQQQWSTSDREPMLAALKSLHEAFISVRDEHDPSHTELAQVIVESIQEVDAAKPNRLKVLGYISALAATVQTIPSIQPAFDVLRTVARAIGFPV